MGMLEVRPDAIAFRHELARRAVEGSLPVVARLGLNARVLAALLATQDPDPSRVVHHAVEAGDDAAVVAHAPSAAAMANRAGAHAQEVEFYEHALRRRHLLAARDQAAVLQACALALFVLAGSPRRGPAGRTLGAPLAAAVATLLAAPVVVLAGRVRATQGASGPPAPNGGRTRFQRRARRPRLSSTPRAIMPTAKTKCSQSSAMFIGTKFAGTLSEMSRPYSHSTA
jgi:hypothetical protein